MFTRSARFYDAMYSWKDYAAETETLQETIRDRAPGARTLLDVACGTGKHLEHLRGRFGVEGLDLDPHLLDQARERLPGITLHLGDMVDFDLGTTFDVVTCLFSSIGYAGSIERLTRAVAAMARHVAPGGLLIVEPWFTPDTFRTGEVFALFVDLPGVKIARMDIPRVEGTTSVIDFDYLVGTSEGIERFTEHHELGLFTDRQYREAFVAAGLDPDHDPEGLMGRGLYVGVRPT